MSRLLVEEAQHIAKVTGKIERERETESVCTVGRHVAFVLVPKTRTFT